MSTLVTRFNSLFNYPDIGKLVLRVSFGIMLLLHGIHKMHGGGTDFIQTLLAQHGLPAFIAYGVYLGEVLAPVMLILGLYTRIASVIIIGTCCFIILLMHSENLFTLSKVGAWIAESVGMYLFSSLALLFFGSGKYALIPDQR